MMFIKRQKWQTIKSIGSKPSMLINYDEVAAYLCKDDGVVERMNDDEMRNTGAYALDKASTITSHIFNELMDIENEL